jgi:hypothetical protein
LTQWTSRRSALSIALAIPDVKADDLINQGIRLYGISSWRSDRQDFESRVKQIKALAFKRVE